MTKEEAIKGLKSLVEVRRKYIDMQTMKDEIEALDMAIKALEQQSCNDCISRQAAEAIFRNAKKSLYEQSRKGKIEYKEFQIREMMLLNAEQFIHLLPSAEPERKPGKWIGEQSWCLPKCSMCGASCFGLHGFDAIKTPYCPTCGARMEVDNG